MVYDADSHFALIGEVRLQSTRRYPVLKQISFEDTKENERSESSERSEDVY